MELEFDKEIDSLLRRADGGSIAGKNGGEGLGPHLDADELTAFAENVVPERVRPLYMSHLADCGRCRGILSGLIAFHAEAEPPKERVVAPARPVGVPVGPWYRRFLLPNLAYVMAGLVLIFGGLIAISFLRSSQMEQAATVSQAVDQESGRGPMAAQPAESTYSTNANTASVAANANANRALGVASNSANMSVANATGRPTETRSEPAPADEKARISRDGADVNITSADSSPAAPPPPKAEVDDLLAMKPGVIRDEDRKVEEAKKKDAAGERADGAVSSRQVKELPRTQAGGVTKSTPGPSRELQQNFPNRADNTFEMNEQKRVGGKGFQLRNDVWYDNTYRGQTTTNVRRNTEEYRKLDSGLRKIAESIDGVVVVVWKGKAYRIQ